MSEATMPPAGWYPDPAGSGDERYWDGETWSQVTRPRKDVPPSPGRRAAADGSPAYAPWLLRVVAYIGDWLLLLYPIGLLQTWLVPRRLGQAVDNFILDTLGALQRGSVVMPEVSPEVTQALLWTGAVSVLAWGVYRTVCVALLGGSLGQMVLRLRVVREGDEGRARLGWGQSALRGFAAPLFFVLPFVGIIDVLAPLFNRRRQALHDMIARTVVVRADQGTRL